MSGSDAALAIFAKTPGLTPAKTRLAAGVGTDAAEEFYRLSLACVEAVAERVAVERPVRPVWAVAEGEGTGDPRWSAFRTVPQGTGGLGDRLHAVSSALLAEHPAVLLIGTDSPHLTPEQIAAPAERLLDPTDPVDFHLGRCEDGGYWLLGLRRPVPRAAWNAVDYSTARTAEQTAAVLRAIGTVADAQTSFDVDTVEDLTTLRDELTRRDSLLPEQRTLLEWLRVASRSPRPPRRRFVVGPAGHVTDRET